MPLYIEVVSKRDGHVRRRIETSSKVSEAKAHQIRVNQQIDHSECYTQIKYGGSVITGQAANEDRAE